jgi:MoaA/NifB/PqqE/SkfB family radical SAM enzyme
MDDIRPEDSAALLLSRRGGDHRPARFAPYDAKRDFSAKSHAALCYAPYTNLYFDNRANVRICCHNSVFPVGNILETTIDEIWQNARIVSLRQSLAAYQFGQGCEFCVRQAADDWFASLSMQRFDEFAVASAAPEWPAQMEFSISNACNLECIMCGGLWSSAIRRRRENLPPLPHLYSRDFLLSLRKYLPHLKRAKFLGGEPFLIREYYVLWNMIAAEGLATPCHVTTNGTQLNPHVREVMDKLPFSIAVSMDGATKTTVERIRVNADFDALMRNVREFRTYARERGTSFSLTYCLMRQNWHEFGAYCALADELDCTVAINTVTHPPEFGLYSLAPAALRQVVRGMEIEAPRLERRLGRNKPVWFAEFERLRRRAMAAPAAA